MDRLVVTLLLVIGGVSVPAGNSQSIRVGKPADPTAASEDVLVVQEFNPATGQPYGTMASLYIGEMRTRLAGVADIGIVTIANHCAAITPESVSTPGVRCLRTAEATVNALDILRVRPAVGRGFVASDAHGTARLAVLSAGAWQREFAANLDVVGKLLWQRGYNNPAEPILVIGVLPAGVLTSTPELDPDIDAIVFTPTRFSRPAPGERWFAPIVRLSPGARVEQAQRRIDDAVAAVRRRGDSQLERDTLRLGLFSLRNSPRRSGPRARRPDRG